MSDETGTYVSNTKKDEPFDIWDAIAKLTAEKGNFVTVLGPRDLQANASGHTVPQAQTPTRLENKVEDSCVIECFGKWTGFKRRQFGGHNYEEAFKRALEARGEAPPPEPKRNLGARRKHAIR